LAGKLPQSLPQRFSLWRAVPFSGIARLETPRMGRICHPGARQVCFPQFLLPGWPVFAETELNTLMKKYQENQQHKDEFYNARKERLKQESRVTDAPPVAANEDQMGETAEILSKLELLEDPWEQHKKTPELGRIDDDDGASPT
jgi:hypothetical protein